MILMMLISNIDIVTCNVSLVGGVVSTFVTWNIVTPTSNIVSAMGTHINGQTPIETEGHIL